MNPTRLIIGEIRGAECFDSAASNTGHRGSISPPMPPPREFCTRWRP